MGMSSSQRPADGVMRVVLASANCELEIPLGTVPPGAAVQVAIRAGDILLATEAPRASAPATSCRARSMRWSRAGHSSSRR